MDGRSISCNDAGKILLDLRFDTRDTAVVYFPRHFRSKQSRDVWVSSSFALVVASGPRSREARRVGASEMEIQEKMEI